VLLGFVPLMGPTCPKRSFILARLVQYLLALYVSFCVFVSSSLDGLRGLGCVVIFISCYWLVGLAFIQQCILVSVKFCASSRGYTLGAFEFVWFGSFMFNF